MTAKMFSSLIIFMVILEFCRGGQDSFFRLYYVILINITYFWSMAKVAHSISIDEDISERIENQSKEEVRNFSNMVEFIAKKYFEAIDKKKK